MVEKVNYQPPKLPKKPKETTLFPVIVFVVLFLLVIGLIFDAKSYIDKSENETFRYVPLMCEEFDDSKDYEHTFRCCKTCDGLDLNFSNDIMYYHNDMLVSSCWCNNNQKVYNVWNLDTNKGLSS